MGWGVGVLYLRNSSLSHQIAFAPMSGLSVVIETCSAKIIRQDYVET